MTSANPPATAPPRGLWRADLVSKLGGGLVLVLLFGLMFGATDVNSVQPGIDLVDVDFGLAMGLVLTLFWTEAWLVALSQIYFRIRWGTPLRLGRFLEDARARHLLRTVGPTYQFRHATLQDRLALPLSSVDA